MKIPFILLGAFLTFQASAFVSIEEKENRVNFLRELQEKVPQMDIEAYERELNYEKQNLSVEERARNESRLIAEKIRLQVTEAYESARKNKSADDAADEVRAAIEKDSSLMASDVQDEIKNYSLRVLEDVQTGKITYTDLPAIEAELIDDVTERMNFLNEEAETTPLLSGNTTGRAAVEKKQYSSAAELVSLLASNGENARGFDNSSNSIRSVRIKIAEAGINMSVRAEFLGVALSAGPSLRFSRFFETSAAVWAEGMTPSTGPNGTFDFNVKDRFGRVVMEKGKPKKKIMQFWCEANLAFEANLSAGAGLSVAGMGADTRVTGIYKNAVNITSRRVFVPEFINNQSTSMGMLSALCHKPFLNAKITNNMTIMGSLNLMMKHLISGLRYTHPKSKCGTDSHCVGWFKKNISLRKANNYPRCMLNNVEKYYTCEARGLQGQSCPVYDAKGKRISSGSNEYFCDWGLKCVTVSQGSFLVKAKGECRPSNPRSYKAPKHLK